MLKIQDWPYMKAEQRETLHRRLSIEAFPETNKPMTLDEFIGMSGGGLGGQ